MAGKQRVVVYLEENYVQILQKRGNVSEYIRQLVHKDINKASTIEQKLLELDIQKREHQRALKEIEEEHTQLKQIQMITEENINNEE